MDKLLDFLLLVTIFIILLKDRKNILSKYSDVNIEYDGDKSAKSLSSESDKERFKEN